MLLLRLLTQDLNELCQLSHLSWFNFTQCNNKRIFFFKMKVQIPFLAADKFLYIDLSLDPIVLYSYPNYP